MTTDERMEKMEGQLARIRWVNRCLIACIVVALGVWFVLKTFGPETAWAGSGVKEIRANRFVVEDENGYPCVALAVDRGPMLVLRDQNGKMRATLIAALNQTSLSLYDEKGRGRIRLMAGEYGPDVSLYGENGKAHASLGDDGVMLWDENDKARAALSLYPHPFGPTVTLRDENEEVIWSAP